MAYLTFLGAAAGSPTEIELEVAPQYEAGKEVAAQSGCLACHKFGENGNDGPGPELTEIGAKLPAQAIERTLIDPSGIMPAYGEPAAGEVRRPGRVPRLAAVRRPHQAPASRRRWRRDAADRRRAVRRPGPRRCSTGSPASTT